MSSFPLLLSSALLLAAPSIATIPADPAIARMVGEASADSIRQHVQRLQDFKTRYALSDSCRAAEKYLYDYFQAQGLDSAAYDTVIYQGTAIRNVIGTIRGSVDPGALIILCAHLDAISPTPLLCAPGAEDNASGIAVVMEAARILGKYRPKYTIKLVAFTGEEEEFLGSEHMARALRSSNTRIAALLNLDMIAWPGGAFGVKVLCDSATRTLADVELAAIETYTSLDPQTVVRIPLPSDNYPFQIRGYPCLSNIERMEQSTDAYVWYHTCGDTLGHMSMLLAAEVAKAATATLVMLQDIPAPPGNLEPSVSAGPGAIHVRWEPNKEADLAGYVLHWGCVGGKYTDSTIVGPRTTTADIATPCGDSSLHLAATAFDSTGNASWPSFEASVNGDAGLVPPRNSTSKPATFWVRNTTRGLEIEYRLDRPRQTSLTLFSPTGRMLESLIQKWQPAGTYRVSWSVRKALGGHSDPNLVIVQLNGRSLTVPAIE